MRALLVVTLLSLLSLACAAQEPLAGRWEGKIQSMQGSRDTVVIFKKEGAGYIGRSAGLRPGTEAVLRDVKIDGEIVTAVADMETPQATLTINYRFSLKGETLKGQGSLDFGGQAVTFDLDLKRVSDKTDGPVIVAGAAGGQRPAPQVNQPQQKQGLDYFVGQWNFRYVGRESALGMAPREGVITFVKAADGKSLNATIEGKADGAAYKESAVVTYDDVTKQLKFNETLANGTKVRSTGDWSSPISIRFEVDPLRVKGQALQLRRIIQIVAAHSFTVTEELSEGGGPFVRLGNAVYSRVITP